MRVAGALTALILLAVGIVGCVERQPSNPATVARIERLCEDSGFFKLVNGAVVAAVPPASLPISIVNAGIDRVCLDPERFAGDISTVQWLAKNLHARAG